MTLKAGGGSAATVTILGTPVVYVPGTPQTYNVTSTTLTAVDPVNLTIPFVVPASGRVRIFVTIGFAWEPPVTATDAFLGLLDHTSGALVGNPMTIGGTLANGLIGSSIEKSFLLIGLTPGVATQLDLAAAASNVSGSAYMALYVSAAASKNIAANPSSPAVMIAQSS